MFATLTASALLLAAQAAAPAPLAEPAPVAEPTTARASETSAGGKPAERTVLIDLGTGEAAEDPAKRADRAYHAASAGRSGYRLSLADGSTADVRSAARREVRTAARAEPPATIDQ